MSVRVEYGIGIGTEFLPVALQTGCEVLRQRLQPLDAGEFVVGLGIRNVENDLQGKGGLVGVHRDAADAGEELGQLVPHLRQAAGGDLNLQLCQGRLAVGGFDGADLDAYRASFMSDLHSPDLQR